MQLNSNTATPASECESWMEKWWLTAQMTAVVKGTSIDSFLWSNTRAVLHRGLTHPLGEPVTSSCFLLWPQFSLVTILFLCICIWHISAISSIWKLGSRVGNLALPVFSVWALPSCSASLYFHFFVYKMRRWVLSCRVVVRIEWYNKVTHRWLPHYMCSVNNSCSITIRQHVFYDRINQELCKLGKKIVLPTEINKTIWLCQEADP